MFYKSYYCLLTNLKVKCRLRFKSLDILRIHNFFDLFFTNIIYYSNMYFYIFYSNMYLKCILIVICIYVSDETRGSDDGPLRLDLDCSLKTRMQTFGSVPHLLHLNTTLTASRKSNSSHSCAIKSIK